MRTLLFRLSQWHPFSRAHELPNADFQFTFEGTGGSDLVILPALGCLRRRPMHNLLLFVVATSTTSGVTSVSVIAHGGASLELFQSPFVNDMSEP